LKGKHALITGGSKGIGYACAASFVSESGNVTLAARDIDSLKSAQSRLNAAYPDIEVKVCVTHPAGFN
jgi:short-subunit dehydrogenase